MSWLGKLAFLLFGDQSVGRHGRCHRPASRLLYHRHPFDARFGFHLDRHDHMVRRHLCHQPFTAGHRRHRFGSLRTPKTANHRHRRLHHLGRPVVSAAIKGINGRQKRDTNLFCLRPNLLTRYLHRPETIVSLHPPNPRQNAPKSQELARHPATPEWFPFSRPRYAAAAVCITFWLKGTRKNHFNKNASLKDAKVMNSNDFEPTGASTYVKLWPSIKVMSDTDPQRQADWRDYAGWAVSLLSDFYFLRQPHIYLNAQVINSPHNQIRKSIKIPLINE